MAAYSAPPWYVVLVTTAAQMVVAMSNIVLSTIAPKVAESLGVAPVLVGYHVGLTFGAAAVASVYGGRVADAIARAIGREVAAGGFKFLSSHATMDVDHMAKLNRLLKTIDDPAAQESVVNSTRVNFHQFGQLFGESGFASHLAA